MAWVCGSADIHYQRVSPGVTNSYHKKGTYLFLSTRSSVLLTKAAILVLVGWLVKEIRYPSMIFVLKKAVPKMLFHCWINTTIKYLKLFPNTTYTDLGQPVFIALSSGRWTLANHNLLPRGAFQAATGGRASNCSLHRGWNTLCREVEVGQSLAPTDAL